MCRPQSSCFKSRKYYSPYSLDIHKSQEYPRKTFYVFIAIMMKYLQHEDPHKREKIKKVSVLSFICQFLYHTIFFSIHDINILCIRKYIFMYWKTRNSIQSFSLSLVVCVLEFVKSLARSIGGNVKNTSSFIKLPSAWSKNIEKLPRILCNSILTFAVTRVALYELELLR